MPIKSRIRKLSQDRFNVLILLMLLASLQLLLTIQETNFTATHFLTKSKISSSWQSSASAKCTQTFDCPIPTSASIETKNLQLLSSAKCCIPYRSLNAVNDSHDPEQTYTFPAHELHFHGPHKVKCDSNTELFIAVKSTFRNLLRRRVLRSTWMSKHNCTPVAERNKRFCDWLWQRTRVAFFVSTPLNIDKTDLFAVMDEISSYGDVVQISFVEHYNNLTLKTVSSLYWAASHCWQAKYIISADDDALLNMPRIWQTILAAEGDKETLADWQADELHRLHRHRPFNNALFGGYLRFNELVQRSQSWITSTSAYLPPVYPDLIVGWFVLMSRCVVETIVRASMCTRLLWIDDVFLFGILAEALDLPRHPVQGLVPLIDRPAGFPYNETVRNGSVALLYKDDEDIQPIWLLCN